jgi:hypothetical protein
MIVLAFGSMDTGGGPHGGAGPPANSDITGASEDKHPPDVSEDKNPTDVVVCDAAAVFAAFARDEAKADNDMTNKWLVVKGKVEKIGKDVLGTPYVALSNGEEHSDFCVQCVFTKADEGVVSRLTPGQTVTIVGKCRGKMGNVLMAECRFCDNKATWDEIVNAEQRSADQERQRAEQKAEQERHAVGSPTILFSDDFSSGTAAGWTEYDGSFAVVGGAYQITSNNGDFSNNNDARAVIGSPSWSDYRIDLDYKITKTGASDWPVAALFRVSDIASGQNMGHYYQFLLGPKRLGFDQIIYGNRDRLAWGDEVEASLSVGTWHHLRLEISGATGTAYVDGKHIMTCERLSDFPSGKIGLKCIHGGSALFKNVRVQSIPEPSSNPLGDKTE